MSVGSLRSFKWLLCIELQIFIHSKETYWKKQTQQMNINNFSQRFGVSIDKVYLETNLKALLGLFSESVPTETR